jgi:hypothetical protein
VASKKMQSLTISVKKWLHGGRNESSLLLNEATGRMCCLGFVAKKFCGADDAQIVGRGNPDSVPGVFRNGAKYCLEGDVDSSFTKRAMHLNDNEFDEFGNTGDDAVRLTLPERKKRLHAHFKTVGIALRFVP